jgi:hypothetical protein
MRWLLLVLTAVVLLGASPGVRYLVATTEPHLCAASTDSADGCPESEQGCSGEVHVCICHAWPVFLPAEGVAEIAFLGCAELLVVLVETDLTPDEHRLRVERPPQRV